MGRHRGPWAADVTTTHRARHALPCPACLGQADNAAGLPCQRCAGTGLPDFRAILANRSVRHG